MGNLYANWDTADSLADQGLIAFKKNNKIKAKDMWIKACNGASMRGCYNLGVMYSDGDGVKQDKNKAQGYYRKACSGGDMGGCYNLAFMYRYDDGVEQDISKAIELYRIGCDGGHTDSCNNYKRLTKG